MEPSEMPPSYHLGIMMLAKAKENMSEQSIWPSDA